MSVLLTILFTITTANMHDLRTAQRECLDGGNTFHLKSSGELWTGICVRGEK